MKKIVSLTALCAVLFGAVLMVTGCGQPAGQSVWKVTKMRGHDVPAESSTYWCFHTDGIFYDAYKENGKLKALIGGFYKVDTNAKTITLSNDGDDQVFSYEINGEKMTLKGKMFDGPELEWVLQKTKDYTEKQIKGAVRKN